MHDDPNAVSSELTGQNNQLIIEYHIQSIPPFQYGSEPSLARCLYTHFTGLGLTTFPVL